MKSFPRFFLFFLKKIRLSSLFSCSHIFYLPFWLVSSGTSDKIRVISPFLTFLPLISFLPHSHLFYVPLCLLSPIRNKKSFKIESTKRTWVGGGGGGNWEHDCDLEQECEQDLRATTKLRRCILTRASSTFLLVIHHHKILYNLIFKTWVRFQFN